MLLPGHWADGVGGPGAAVHHAGPGGELQNGRPAAPSAGQTEGDRKAPEGLHGADQTGHHRRRQEAAGGL